MSEPVHYIQGEDQYVFIFSNGKTVTVTRDTDAIVAILKIIEAADHEAICDNPDAFD